ncbi:MAG: transcriptional regulator, partial [Mesorhizobium sp.]
EQMVRGALMAETVDCPVLGPLGRNACLDWQAKPFAPTSSHRMTMHRACKTCPQRRK